MIDYIVMRRSLVKILQNVKIIHGETISAQNWILVAEVGKLEGYLSKVHNKHEWHEFVEDQRWYDSRNV